MKDVDYYRLKKLGERDRWDIEALWLNRSKLDLETLERFDALGWVELRIVGIQWDNHSSPRTNPGSWYSLIARGESWLKYYPRDEDDRRLRIQMDGGAVELNKGLGGWRSFFNNGMGLPARSELTNTQVFEMCRMAPVELRVTVAGRHAMVKHECGEDGAVAGSIATTIDPAGVAQLIKQTMTGLIQPASTVVLWAGGEHTKQNVRLARTRTAYLEAGGKVADALKALKANGNPIAPSTFYGHLKKLDARIPGWRGR